MATSKTASSPPCSLSFSLKFPPAFRTAPEVSEHVHNPNTNQKQKVSDEDLNAEGDWLITYKIIETQQDHKRLQFI